MKLDMTEKEAEQYDLLRRFPFYANEAITYICSAIKPKYSFANVIVLFSDEHLHHCIPLSDIVKLDCKTHQAIYVMPNDFISFGEDVNTIQRAMRVAPCHTVYQCAEETSDDDFEYYDYNKVLFKCAGIFDISYNARWFTFSNDTLNGLQLDIPTDIVEALPSYIASQCLKSNDEVKSSLYRNEYEMMLSRIDVANPRNTKNIHIGGGW